MKIVPVKTKEDILLLAKKADIVWHEYFKTILSLEQIDYMVEKFQSACAITNQIEENGYEYYFIKYKEEIAGYTAIKKEEDKLFLSKLYILKEYRKKGLSSFAFSFIKNYAVKNLLKSVYLTVNRENTDSIDVYKHWGFDIIKEQKADIGKGFYMDDYIMEKKLYNPKSMKAEEFIDHNEILETLKYADENKDNLKLVEEILAKARLRQGLTHREASVLLACDIPKINEEMYKLAKEIKQDFYGNRIVMFAPLYLSNYCVNGCVYCPYHAKNKHITRKKLTQEEVKNEVIALQDMGHKRLAIESGEDPVNNPIEYILECIKTIYSIKHKNGAIRRVNVNIAATTVENYKKLKDAGIGTYILFQETYHKESYEKLHPTGPKHNYAYHTEAMDRAMEAGIDDVGLGVLFGLELYRYEFAGLLMHAEHLEAVHGVGPHTISVPRIKRADDIDPDVFDNGIDDETFAKLCALIRISVPYTGMIISTRESQKVREKVIELGVSQISGASKTSVGGYSEPEPEDENSEQFDVSDKRTLDEVVNWLMRLGHIPSFCTACYREGRTGDRFMTLLKSGQIINCCHPNALMTLKEYLLDYASKDTREIGEKLIKEELNKITNEKVKKLATDYIENMENGKRDFRF